MIEVSTNGEANVSKTLSSSPPPLLLEGDGYFFSDEGIARTFYRLKRPDFRQSASTCTALSVEEVYDLRAARKTFILRAELEKHSSKPQIIGRGTTINIGPPCSIIDFQEIGQGIAKGAGTGAFTWESSLAMFMFFSSSPHLLRGKVVELGSGTGAGGILMSSLAAPSLNLAQDVESVTLTDYNTQVLEQCRENIAKATAVSSFMKALHLDWYDFLHPAKDSNDLLHKFDTVVACDCAYLYPDIQALYQAMLSVLKKDEDSRIHLFGPYNRGAIAKLMELLHLEVSQAIVSTDMVDMERFRLKPPTGMGDLSIGKTECCVASKSGAKFLHSTISLRPVGCTEIQRADAGISKID